ncbi:MAG: RNA polymerase sigma factor [Minisyncoccia bacterium]
MLSDGRSYSDEELVAAYNAGDESVFAVLVERHLPSVYALARKLGADASEADDISQDTFLKVWKNIKKFRPQSAQFKTWLLHIARNTIIDLLRKRKAVSFSSFETEEGGNVLLETLAADEPLPDEQLSTTIDAERLAEAMKHLPLGAQEVLHLHYREALTFEEIGRMLDEPLNTIKSRHRRAVLALRQVLGNQMLP